MAPTRKKSNRATNRTCIAALVVSVVIICLVFNFSLQLSIFPEVKRVSSEKGELHIISNEQLHNFEDAVIEKDFPDLYFVVLSKVNAKRIQDHTVNVMMFNGKQKISQADMRVVANPEKNEVKILSRKPFQIVTVVNEQEDLAGASIKATLDGGESWFLRRMFRQVQDVYYFIEGEDIEFDQPNAEEPVKQEVVPEQIDQEKKQVDKVTATANVEEQIDQEKKQIDKETATANVEDGYSVTITKVSENQIKEKQIYVLLFNQGKPVTMETDTSMTHSGDDTTKIHCKKPFDEVFVSNRKDCCQKDIVGGTVKATADGGQTWFLDSTFRDAELTYFFSPRKKFVLIESTGNPQVNEEAILNLGEVTLYSKGVKIPNSKTQCLVSGIIQPYCNDGNLNTILHSFQGLPWAVFVSEEDYDEVEVVNRSDCCKHRIVGASIKGTMDGGLTWDLEAKFVEEKDRYKFTLGAKGATEVSLSSPQEDAAETGVVDEISADAKPPTKETILSGQFAVVISQAAGKIINLAEVLLYYQENKVSPLQLKIVFFYPDAGSSSSAIECNNFFFDDFCHSDGGAKSITELWINSEVMFDKISVYNRPSNMDRIVGATIKGTLDGGNTWSKSTFVAEELIYTFILASMEKVEQM